MRKATSMTSAQLTVLSEEPLVAGAALTSLDSVITPSSGFFVRNHFPIPKSDISSWSLTVTGEVERPLHLRYDDLLRLPSKEIVAQRYSPPLRASFGTMVLSVLPAGLECLCVLYWSKRGCWIPRTRCCWREPTMVKSAEHLEN